MNDLIGLNRPISFNSFHSRKINLSGLYLIFFYFIFYLFVFLSRRGSHICISVATKSLNSPTLSLQAQLDRQKRQPNQWNV